jgi:hypothetical protein
LAELPSHEEGPRDPGTIAWPNPRFEVGTGSAAETVKDLFANLTWAQSPPAAGMNREDAVAQGFSVPGAAIWTSTTCARNTDLAWTVWLGGFAGTDDPGTFPKSIDSHNYAWPVRGP